MEPGDLRLGQVQGCDKESWSSRAWSEQYHVRDHAEQNYLVFIAIYLVLDWSLVSLVLLFVSICIGLLYLHLSAFTK